MQLIYRSRWLRSGPRALTGALLAASALVASLAPGVAQAAAEEPAPLPTAILGGWEVTGHQVLADGGATTYHYERDPHGARGMVDAEIQWHRSSAAEIGQQLEAQGLQPAGTMPTVVSDQRAVEAVFVGGDIEEADNMTTSGTAQVYAALQSGSELFQAAGVWEEGGFTYVATAQVPSLYMLERLLERVERLDGAVPQATISERGRRHARHGRRHAHHHHAHKKGRAAH
jgi:hypothetical protein